MRQFVLIVVSIPHRQATNCNDQQKIMPVICFNSSQVGYKHAGKNNSEQLSHYRFQFLIGRLQTIPVVVAHDRDIPVSIPHRQATNEPYARFFPFIMSSFQFLIGRLQTNRRDAACGDLEGRFQFLIGRLQTKVIAPGSSSCSCFNSSQVGYKRLCLHYDMRHDWAVSIPHRQATNSRNNTRKDDHDGFQFLIGRLQTR